MEALRAAVQNGADAVYLGCGAFNARQGAKNFTLETLPEAVKYAHVRGVAIHLTVNTLVSDREMPQVAELLKVASQAEVDALIVQDLGVLRLCRQIVPHIPIHASTQMTIHSLDGVKAAADLGPLLLDGLADGIWIDAPGHAAAAIRDVELMILQAARVRFSHTEYIACPSCGRTLYDIERTLAAIKSRTSHLKNLKIGVMGCIVNGPGEMADADYGYVGAGPGRITLYRGREVVARNIPQEEALDRLVELIRAHGDWVDPEV